jgi:RimJ/RimL family protein N-acetyltransferase
MVKRLTTERTFLRPFRLTDANSTFEWFSDDEVMRYIPYGSDTTLGQTKERIGRYIKHQSRHGFSKWLIHETESGMPIGDAGFSYLPDGVRVEFGYRLKKSHWGRGLATEVSAKWLSVAKDWFGFTEVYAFAHPQNTASLRVMQKLGFYYSHTEQLYEMEAPIYKLTLAE